MIWKLPAAAGLMLMCAGAWANDIPRPVLKLPPQGVQSAPPLPAILKDAGAWSQDAIAAGRRSCAAKLKGLALTYTELAPIGAPGGCGAAAPILISSINGVAIEPPAEATCDLAEALHGWVTTSLQPAAREELKKEVTGIDNASAYMCRRRNGQSTGKLSEHAMANALDVARLRFSDGSSMSVKGEWSGIMGTLGISAKASFLERIRRDACARFTTVLGPGSDSFHKDHFHVDMVRRKNGYRICQ